MRDLIVLNCHWPVNFVVTKLSSLLQPVKNFSDGIQFAAGLVAGNRKQLIRTLVRILNVPGQIQSIIMQSSRTQVPNPRLQRHTLKNGVFCRLRVLLNFVIVATRKQERPGVFDRAIMFLMRLKCCDSLDHFVDQALFGKLDSDEVLHLVRFREHFRNQFPLFGFPFFATNPI